MSTVTRNLVLLKTSYGYITEADYDSFSKPGTEIWNGYSQYSHPIKVEFEELDDDTKLTKELKALDQIINSVRNEATKRLEELNTKRQELLALTYSESK